jgi:hypothetical protein
VVDCRRRARVRDGSGSRRYLDRYDAAYRRLAEADSLTQPLADRERRSEIQRPRAQHDIGRREAAVTNLRLVTKPPRPSSPQRKPSTLRVDLGASVCLTGALARLTVRTHRQPQGLVDPVMLDDLVHTANNSFCRAKDSGRGCLSANGGTA